MRAAIYNPYLDTLGGGERYAMAVANALIQKGYVVDVEWKDKGIKTKLEDRFGIKLPAINFVQDVKKGDGYDLIFWVSDGSVPLLRARNNILHFQIPFKNVNGKSLLNRMKFFRINKIVCNSKFTKNVIDQEYGVKTIVVYPPVDVEKFKPKKKGNIILYVGRFSQLTQTKGQNILIDAFKEFYKKGFPNWKLILAGGVEVGADKYLSDLKKTIKGYPIEILESPGFSTLKEICGNAKIFWSAVGYGINDDKEPNRVEHFGIAPVEAMSASCVPFLYRAGGHKEIVNEPENGFLWTRKSELIKKTINLINNQKILRAMSGEAQKSAKLYSYERFDKEVSSLF